MSLFLTDIIIVGVISILGMFFGFAAGQHKSVKGLFFFVVLTTAIWGGILWQSHAFPEKDNVEIQHMEQENFRLRQTIDNIAQLLRK